MPASRFSAFGQELYPEASLRAVQLALKIPERPRLLEAIIASLDQRSPKTRLRIADKLLQRFVGFVGGQVNVAPYLRLVAQLNDPRAAQQLLFWRLADVDAVVGAITREVLFPYLVERRPPSGWSQAAFRSANSVGLFEGDGVITRDFISRYARERWQFTSQASLTRALRILRQVGLIEPIIRLAADRRLLAFARVPFSLSLPTLCFGLHSELTASGGALAPDQIQHSDLAKLFLQETIQINLLLEQARRAGLLSRSSRGGNLLWRAACLSEEDLATRLLEG